MLLQERYSKSYLEITIYDCLSEMKGMYIPVPFAITYVICVRKLESSFSEIKSNLLTIITSAKATCLKTEMK